MFEEVETRIEQVFGNCVRTSLLFPHTTHLTSHH